jgi:hypothetical protein
MRFGRCSMTRRRNPNMRQKFKEPVGGDARSKAVVAAEELLSFTAKLAAAPF